MIHRPNIAFRDPDEPQGIHRLAEKRTTPLVAQFGRTIQTMTILELAMCCYLQGADDAITVCLKDERLERRTAETPSWENMQ